jgi:hypothetical protein
MKYFLNKNNNNKLNPKFEDVWIIDEIKRTKNKDIKK